MSVQQHARQYLEKQIQNATPAEQIVMLYDGAIKFCRKAQRAIDDKDIQGRHNANSRAMEIVCYLLEILDEEKGGELATRLKRIYGYALQRLIEVDTKNSKDAAEDVVTHLKMLRDAWQELSEQGVEPSQPQETSPKAQAPSSQTAPSSSSNNPYAKREEAPHPPAKKSAFA
jgi:flagellar protein FliS